MASLPSVDSYRSRRAIVCLVAGLACGCGVGLMAFAQDSAGGSAEANRMFQTLDTNKDGRLTMEEAGPNSQALLQNIFQMAGKQRGAAVSRSEFQQVFERHRAQSGGGGNGGGGGRPNPPPRASGRPDPESPSESDEESLPPLLARLDGNSDGRLTRAELQRLTQLFERLDANKDGALSVAEIQDIESVPNSDNKSPAETKTPARGSRPTPKTAETSTPKTGSRTGNRPTTGTGSTPGAGQTLPTGVWRGWVVNGRGENPNSGQMEIELTVEGNRIIGRELGTQRAPGGLGGGTFTISGDGKSGNLDAEGNSGQQDGRSFMGIYEFDGETLRWCVANRGRTRPQVMATDRGNYLMVLRQQK